MEIDLHQHLQPFLQLLIFDLCSSSSIDFIFFFFFLPSSLPKYLHFDQIKSQNDTQIKSLIHLFHFDHPNQIPNSSPPLRSSNSSNFVYTQQPIFTLFGSQSRFDVLRQHRRIHHLLHTTDDDDEYEEVEEEESLPRVSDFGQGPVTKRSGGDWREGFRLFKAVSGIEVKLIACFVPFDVMMDDSGGVAQSGLGLMLILVNGDRIWISWFDDDDDGFC
ncbi:hypothetical protein QYF36_006948 [Acer negundo]|nr:hypothetical protein QYF36_006948 [Acer negundo]